MDLLTMENRCEEILGLAGQIGATRLDEEMNWVYQYEIPTRLGSTTHSGFVDFATVASQQDYDIDTLAAADGSKILKSLVEPITEKDMPRTLRFTDQPRIFWDWHDIGDTTQERSPYSALLLGRTLTLRPIPDGVYNMRFYANLYRAALTSDGVSNTIEAMATVAGAAVNLAISLGRDKSLERAVAMHEKAIGMLFVKSYSGSSSPLSHAQADTRLPGSDF